jgi:plasmid stabilization system protein ParE
MRVRHTSRARRDLEAICDYLDRNNPDAARAVKLAVSRATELLADFPKIALCVFQLQPRHAYSRVHAPA